MRSLSMILVIALFTLGCNSASYDPNEVNNKEPLKPVKVKPASIQETFSIKIPTSDAWEKQFDGPTKLSKDSYVVSYVDKQRILSLTVVVLPLQHENATLDEVKTEWEPGFLKNATEIVSSEYIELNGHPAYQLTARLVRGDAYLVKGVLLVKGNYYYAIGSNRPESLTPIPPEMLEFEKSFQFISE